MASFLSRLQASATFRSQGYQLHGAGAVIVLDQSATRAVARVADVQPWIAVVDWQMVAIKGSIKVACSCPRGLRQPCAHVWALLLWLAENPEAQIDANRPINVRFGFPDDVDVASFLEKPAPSRWRSVIRAAQRQAAAAKLQEEMGTVGEAADWLFLIHENRPKESCLTIAAVSRAAWAIAGSWKPLTIDSHRLPAEPADVAPLVGEMVKVNSLARRAIYWWDPQNREAGALLIPYELLPSLVPRLCATGRFGWPSPELESWRPLRWSAEGPWRVAGLGTVEGEDFELAAVLERDGRRVGVRETRMIVPSGLVFFAEEVGRIELAGTLPWLETLKAEPQGRLRVPVAEIGEALEALNQVGGVPELHLEGIDAGAGPSTPQPQLTMQRDDNPRTRKLRGAIDVFYGDQLAPARFGVGVLVSVQERRLIRRHREAEQALARQALEAGFEVQGTQVTIGRGAFPAGASRLFEQGWRIYAEGRQVRAGGSFRLRVASGIDWFDLHGEMVFGDQAVSFPDLLRAAKARQRLIMLDDGSLGLLPEEWLARYQPIAELADHAEGAALRFPAPRALLLDALLAAEPAVEVDEVFAHARRALDTFRELEALEPPAGYFQGELRPYQQLGLGWLDLLGRLELGGCLADDMGLGKTVQVLAFLARLKAARPTEVQPSLLVVPLSVVHNWVAEARRFTPRLQVMVLHGLDRHDRLDALPASDIVITTYGTLRRDVTTLRETLFRVLVLDEAQSIKNPHSDTAKACRLLKGEIRLALTGTPIENHLGDLWSIFEFLNPGMLGRLPMLGDEDDRLRLPPDTLQQIATVLRPLILRRTKGQVLTELPAKTEQTLFCELSPKERKVYDHLRDYYRRSLSHRVDAEGLGKSKIMVLEALLRLRQVACHMGLVEEAHAKFKSAKVELLLENLQELIAEGHKVLVFSQFTKLLGLVGRRLDHLSIPYEYLDGKTRNRQERIDRFQQDPAIPLFLISLKAGGIGLNLTAASYVFLLDPWWNPAVESQAIDRSHRIGQSRPVFAYRLIAKDTVEERILDLQADKRALADAIVGGDQRLLKGLTREDLDLLLQ